MSAALGLLKLAMARNIWGILALVLITAIGFYAGLGMAAAGFLFFLCVVIQAIRGDLWSATIVATVAAFALACFFSPTIFLFSAAEPLGAIALLTFLIAAFATVHLTALYRGRGKHTINGVSMITGGRGKHLPASQHRFVILFGLGGRALAIIAFLLLVYGLTWTYATHRYLKGFADAIVPLEGSPQEKTEALLNWFRHEPERGDALLEGSTRLRDPVNIVQNGHLLKICGSATNAFINLADVAGLKARRLLLLDRSGGTMHVVAEVEWGEQWVVADPQQGRMFKDQLGRPLTKEELHHPEVFQDAIRRMPGYSPGYTFERTAHVHLERLPFLGHYLRRSLNGLSPGWEEAADWGYFPENPSLWPILISIPMLLFGVLVRLMVDRYGRNKLGIEAARESHRLLGEMGDPESVKSA